LPLSLGGGRAIAFRDGLEVFEQRQVDLAPAQRNARGLDLDAITQPETLVRPQAFQGTFGFDEMVPIVGQSIDAYQAFD
jgi:hypothetical protein